MESLEGRVLSLEELSREQREFVQKHPDQLRKFYGIRKGMCRRCLNQDSRLFQERPCVKGHGTCFYCLDCLAFSRVSTCSALVYLPPTSLDPREIDFYLEHTLSADQERISGEMLESLSKGEDRLIWAVTGAGKTEMTFACIREALSQGKRVAYVSPRIDVCLDLHARYKKAFPSEDIPLLYGESQEEYRFRPFMMMTTHQLVRFYQAFDLLIVDEADAFPFNGSALLERAVAKSVKQRHSIFWLTATPPNFLIEEVRSEGLPISILAGRFHGHPLPEAEFCYVGDWRKKVMKGKLPVYIHRFLKEEFAQGQFLILFMPHIPLMIKMESILKKLHPDWRVASVSAKDPKRLEKVQEAKKAAYDLLLSTTILERGVTFYAIDVAVLGAEDETFSSESLIQIAGRVGRHKDAPSGRVVYFHHGQTKAMRKAQLTIRFLNRFYQEGREDYSDLFTLS